MTDKTEAQPEALELADRLIGNAEIDECEGCNPVVVALERAAATELCRQHAEIQQLKALLSARQTVPNDLTRLLRNLLQESCEAEGETYLSNEHYRKIQDILQSPSPPEREPLLPVSAVAKLRHLYEQLKNGGVRDTAQAKRIAEGLLSPAIEQIESCMAKRGATND